MSRENVEIIESMLGRAAADPSALRAILADDVVFEVGMLAVGEPTYRGPTGVADFFRVWTGAFEDWDYDVLETIDAGESVVVHIRQWGRGKGSGVAVEQRFWQVWTLREGKVFRATHHADREDALAATRS